MANEASSLSSFVFDLDEKWPEFLSKPIAVIDANITNDKDLASRILREPLIVHETLTERFQQLYLSSEDAIDKEDAAADNNDNKTTSSGQQQNKTMSKQERKKRLTDIPLINQLRSLDTLRSGQLVRFQCMVQDMFDPEYYLASYETQSSTGEKSAGIGLYRDRLDDGINEMGDENPKRKNLAINYASPSNVTLNRMTYYCISVPGENAWVRDKRTPLTSSSLSSTQSPSSKVEQKGTNADHVQNTTDDNNVVNDTDGAKSLSTANDAKLNTSGSSTTNSKHVIDENDDDEKNSVENAYKRTKAEEQEEISTKEGKEQEDEKNEKSKDVEEENGENSLNADAAKKKNKSNENGKNSSSTAANINLSFPLNDNNPYRRACLVKVYDANDSSLKLNDLIDVIGIVQFDSPLDVVAREAERKAREEEETAKGKDGASGVNNTTSVGGDERLEYVRALVHDMDLEDHDTQFPSSLYPRIHAISVRSMAHINPLVDDAVLKPEPAMQQQEKNTAKPIDEQEQHQRQHQSKEQQDDSNKLQKPADENVVYQKNLLRIGGVTKEFCTKMRTELKAILAQALFGDVLAADYVLCNILSHIYSRKDVLNLGLFSVNISNLPKLSVNEQRTYIRSLYTLLSNIHTHSVYFPLTLQALNKGTFIPTKNYSNNKLHSGLLQLSNGTLLVIDETAMTAGQLSKEGVENLTTVGELIKWQHLKYDFSYHTMEMDTDVQTLILSEGKSLLPASYRVPLVCTATDVTIEQTFSAINQYLDEHLLDNIRRYLTYARHGDYSIPDSMQEMVQEDFVQIRRSSSSAAKMSPDDLHAWLTLARLMSLSMGETELTSEVWQNVKQMETERARRTQ